MENELDGFVVFYDSSNKSIPLGVISDSYECKAKSNYIPSNIKKFLIEIEDRRFYRHKGIDFKGISRAFYANLKAGNIVQGGSTISQQLARNLIKDNNKTIYRKIKETFKAIQLEKLYSKDEILNLYFNNIYFGKNIWGLRTAGLHYFGKEVEKLNHSELLYLLTILRGPNYYAKREEIAIKRFETINNILFERNVISQNRFQKNKRTKLNLKQTELKGLKTQTIPFIAKSIDKKNKKVNSTIDFNIQEFSKNFVLGSKYPVSIIALKNGKVAGFASSYGTDYPFISKSNVGSTLKPFLYCHYRNNGISKIEKFNAFNNSLNWKVREVGYSKSQLNLTEAMICSNNNVFINAGDKIGLQSCFKFLADILNKSESDFLPSSILGATKCGLSLYELARAYSTFFDQKNLSETKIECLNYLNEIFYEKLGYSIENAFLKTGTTNDNKERYAILGNADLTFAVLRNENEINDESKEGGFIYHISKSFSSIFKSNFNYEWI